MDPQRMEPMDELEAVEYAQTRIFLSDKFKRPEDEWLNIPVGVLRALLARATRSHD